MHLILAEPNAVSFELMYLEKGFVNERSNRMRFSHGFVPSRMDLYHNGEMPNNTHTTLRTSPNDANPDEDQSESTANLEVHSKPCRWFRKESRIPKTKNTVERSLSPQCAGMMVRIKEW